MLERLLRLAAVVTSALVLLAWGAFAVDQARAASAATAQEIERDRASQAPDPSPTQERLREQAHSSPREALDDVNDVLLSPVAGVAAGSSSPWVRRTVPAGLGVVLYGFGLGYLARYARG